MAAIIVIIFIIYACNASNTIKKLRDENETLIDTFYYIAMAYIPIGLILKGK